MSTALLTLTLWAAGASLPPIAVDVHGARVDAAALERALRIRGVDIEPNGEPVIVRAQSTVVGTAFEVELGGTTRTLVVDAGHSDPTRTLALFIQQTLLHADREPAHVETMPSPVRFATHVAPVLTRRRMPRYWQSSVLSAETGASAGAGGRLGLRVGMERAGARVGGRVELGLHYRPGGSSASSMTDVPEPTWAAPGSGLTLRFCPQYRVMRAPVTLDVFALAQAELGEPIIGGPQRSRAVEQTFWSGGGGVRVGLPSLPVRWTAGVEQPVSRARYGTHHVRFRPHWTVGLEVAL